MEKLELIHGDRRADRRYDLELNLRFSYEHSGQTRTGVGFTLDLSRGGVRFFSESPPPVGTQVELHIAWPILLQNVCSLDLVMHGTVLQSGERGTVLRAHDFAFQTCGERSFDQAALARGSCSITA